MNNASHLVTECYTVFARVTHKLVMGDPVPSKNQYFIRRLAVWLVHGLAFN